MPQYVPASIRYRVRNVSAAYTYGRVIGAYSIAGASECMRIYLLVLPTLTACRYSWHRTIKLLIQFYCISILLHLRKYSLHPRVIAALDNEVRTKMKRRTSQR